MNEIVAVGSETVKNLDTDITYITGEKGKGGKAREAVEANNTLRSAAVLKVVEIISEGTIEGICGGAQGIYIDNTPLQNVDGSFNFPRVNWDFRVGLPDQDHMPGFSSASAELSVNAPVLKATPVVRSVTATNIDAARVTIQLPNGLSYQNTKNGDLLGHTVSFRVDTKPTASGAWQTYRSYTITGKTTTPYEAAYRIERPAGTGLWDVRVVRTSDDETLSTKRSNVTWARITEIIDAKLKYNDTALVGIAIDAESVGSSIPTRAYMVKGKIVSVPVNYDPLNKTYSGNWNGLFKQAWTDNPTWVLYDLMTNSRYGLGEYLTGNDIDLYSFYDSAVYNDGLVPDGNGYTEPRFTFSAAIVNQDDAGKLLTLVAGSFRSRLVQLNGKWTLLQDRPSSPVRNITNSNVKEGLFTYKSTGLFERHTAFNVAWNNLNDRYLLKVSTVEDVDGIARYGYFPTDVAAYGATREGQAIRAGKWALDTEQHQTELVTFDMSLNGFDLLPNDVFNLYDEDYTDLKGSGRLVSVVGTTVIIDKPLAITAGSSISVMLADGKTLESRTITQTSGTLSTFNITSGFSQSVLPQADYVVITTIAARQFKILNLRFPEEGVVSIDALYHDPNKYSRVELGINIPPEIFSVSTLNNSIVRPPTSMVFQLVAVRNADTSITRTLQVSWTKATEGGAASSYFVSWSRNGDNATTLTTPQTAISIPVLADGTYTINVFAANGIGQVSGTSLEGTYIVDSEDAGGLGAVQNFYVKGTTGLEWNTDDMTLSWNKNIGDADLTQDYQITIKTLGNTVLWQEVIRTTEFTYTLSKNRADAAPHSLPPQSSLVVTVAPRDMFSRLSTPATFTFVNPPPLAPNISVEAGVKSVAINLSLPIQSDYKGSMIWMSTSASVAHSPENLIYDGPSTSFVKLSLTPGITYYFSAAQYDGFKDTTLNYTSTTSSVPLYPGNIPVTVAIPTSEYLGDVVYSEADSSIYEWITSGTPGYVRSQPLVAAQRIVAASLDVISVHAGNLMSGNYTLDPSSWLRMGAIDYTNGKGLWAGYVAADNVYKFRVGDPSGTMLDFDGVDLSVQSILNNDRVTITAGNVFSEKKIGDAWYQTKALTRSEQGVASNSTAVIIPGYFVSTPRIMVSPASLQTFSTANSAQNQTLDVQATFIRNILGLNSALLGSASVIQGLSLVSSFAGTWRSAIALCTFPSGQWYFEMKVDSTNVGYYMVGLINPSSFNSASYPGSVSTAYGYFMDGNKYTGAASAAYGQPYAIGDYIGIAYDSTLGTVTFFKNGVTMGVAFSGVPVGYAPMVSAYSLAGLPTRVTANFGESPMGYTPPVGYKTLAEAPGFKETFSFVPVARLTLGAGNPISYSTEALAAVPVNPNYLYGVTTTLAGSLHGTSPSVSSISLAGTLDTALIYGYVAATNDGTGLGGIRGAVAATGIANSVNIYVQRFDGVNWIDQQLIYSRGNSFSQTNWAGTYVFPSAGTWTWRLIVVFPASPRASYHVNVPAYSTTNPLRVSLASITQNITEASILAAGTLNWIAVGE